VSTPARPDAEPAHLHLRASQQERHRVVDELRDHFVAGRLEVDEFEERATRAYAARTLTDLGSLLTDLPHRLPEPHGGHGAPLAHGRTASLRGGRRHHPRWSAVRRVTAAPGFRLHTYLWLVVSAFWVGAWFFLTPGAGFWPAVPIAVTGLSVATHAAFRAAARPAAPG